MATAVSVNSCAVDEFSSTCSTSLWGEASVTSMCSTRIFVCSSFDGLRSFSPSSMSLSATRWTRAINIALFHNMRLRIPSMPIGGNGLCPVFVPLYFWYNLLTPEALILNCCRPNGVAYCPARAPACQLKSVSGSSDSESMLPLHGRAPPP